MQNSSRHPPGSTPSVPVSVILAVTNDGIARAEAGADDAWAVTHHAQGQHINCLAPVHPGAPRLYAGGNHGVLRSADGGRTWQPCGLADHSVKSLAVSPHDPRIVYAGTKPAWMFVSRNAGETWEELAGFRRIPNRWWWFSPAEPGDLRPYVFAIALSPMEPNVLLAGIEFGAVVRSEDGGETWSRHRPGALRDCHSLKFHAGDGGWAYEAGGTGGGAAVSRDGGRTWQKAKQGLDHNYGIVCAADPVQPEIWYVCTAPGPGSAFGNKPAAGLYRIGRENKWQHIGWGPAPLTHTPTALVTLPGAPGHLYAGLKNGDVWHTADHGDTWQQLPLNLTGIWFSMVCL